MNQDLRLGCVCNWIGDVLWHRLQVQNVKAYSAKGEMMEIRWARLEVARISHIAAFCGRSAQSHGSGVTSVSGDSVGRC